MAKLLTLIAQLHEFQPDAPPSPQGLVVRPSKAADLQQLGTLYFEAYEPGIACDSLDEATDDIKASFDGEYGEYWYEASPVVEADGCIVSAVMTVRRAPWDDTPDCPFIIELFTARDHRRRGLARLLIRHCLVIAHRSGETAVALRVAEDNTPARALYQSLGFSDWQSLS
ncbi:MAG: GNAT family N-acetyltransferase [Actinobacteria bacterium]|nr:GNAT family N-acetyltransferase [Actinomycetota bacterium]